MAELKQLKSKGGKMKFIKPHHDIIIKQCVNGSWIVKIGCAEIAQSDYKQLVKDLGEYLKNPEKVEKDYNNATILPVTMNWGTMAPGRILYASPSA